MKKFLAVFIVLVLLFSFCSCRNSSEVVENSSETDDLSITQEEVIKKWENEAGVLGTTRFIEDAYKAYPDDEIISNIYFYAVAKEEYENYTVLSDSKYLEIAKEYAAKISPDYSGVFAEEMHDFVSSILDADELKETHEAAITKEDRYNSLTNRDKKKICNYIQGRYDYYDSLNGGYAGDKFSDTIMQEAADKYGLSVSQIYIIWMNYYSY